MANIIDPNILLGIMIMMLLDHYIQNFQKSLAILINLKKKKKMSRMVKDKQFLKKYNKTWKKMKD